MKIIYRKGSLLDTAASYIVHGCNAQGKMGSGVAKVLRDWDENIFTVYEQRHLQSPLQVGEVIVVPSHGKYVMNAITQEFYRQKEDPEGMVYISYDGLREAMRWINEFVDLDGPPWEHEPYEVAMPLIGAGLAGGDWNIIKAIIEEELKDCQPVVFIHDIQMLPPGEIFE